MRKIAEQAKPDSCLNKANPEEMIFVLLGRDVAAPSTIRHWIAMRIKLGKNKFADAQIQEALACAETMERELSE